MLRPKVFQGGYGPEAYLSWTGLIDSCIFHNRMPEHERLPLAINQLRGEAATWWDLEEEERWYYNKPAINTWEELKLLMDKRYIPVDFPQEIKEYYGRRPIRKRVPQAAQKSTPVTLPSKEPELSDPPKECPPPLAIVEDKPEEEVQQNSSDNTRSHEQVLRTKLPQEGGYDAVMKPKDEVYKPKIHHPRSKTPLHVFASFSKAHTSEDPRNISPNKPKIMQSFQWSIYMVKNVPKHHYFMPKLSRYKAPSRFPYLAHNQALRPYQSNH